MNVIQEPRYLGIDESNHGRFPEFFVGVYSHIPQDVIEHSENKLSKHRDKSRTIDSVLRDHAKQERDFRYIVLPEECAEEYGKHQITLFIMSELVNYHDGLEDVIIDGSRKKRDDIMTIKSMVDNPSHLSIRYRAKGDRLFQVVNMADEIAHKLFRNYADQTKIQKPIPQDHELELDLDRLDYCVKNGYFTIIS